MATLEAIQSKIAALQAKADAIASKETHKILAHIQDLMDKHGLSIADIEVHLGGKRRGRPRGDAQAVNVADKNKGKLPPKYMNPKAGETWSDHARPPQWIAGAKDRTKFLIDGNAANKSAGRTAKTKGALPPKFLDPKSGMTWSGRGRVPAWLASAKDRSKYLVAA
jgi:DNA-binding protein H-NS